MNNIRIGYGYDVHKFSEDRKLVLGGIEIPFEKGLLGHSDADVLLHAITDAILGALALGDIGSHFPDDDPKYEGAESVELLKHCYRLVKEKGYVIGNMDATVIAERPKLQPYINSMREQVAKIFETEVGNISVKATTSEKMGFAGREEGIIAQCTVLLKMY
ncbi:2-C-methyl-D-erythritol 2,4-cyclodiphosphate synthase [Gracilimonas amylolytica]|uniref:2-C-methyl-D-erythritol 2,4-cyclodiphosphate synthase n=1 Tax=Gracilimonas amylolytica TaxID=1749045 RepID=UPI000CD8093A|nr:2-C-methyl-D-erythritol 2,4-cyclodiphosphate synthase [Gracilimonas amylolytica]